MTEHFDVLIVGAGISGIGAACHLRAECPGRSFVILEGRDSLGGTWDLFRYPGVRSDSDMHTLGFEFKPWTAAKAIADGPSILEYLRETSREHDLEGRIRLRHRVKRASWSSAEARWTIEAVRTDTGQAVTLTCGFLFMGSGYYSYQHGYEPEFPGRERFRGRVVHPQAWPADLDYTGQRVVVIGSGATAVTLLPSMAKTAAHVTMLQRSPTYVFSMPDTDIIANLLRKVLPERLAYRIVRWKNTSLQQFIYWRSRVAPDKVRKHLIGEVRKALGPDADVERHFTPTYNPWDQRLCLIPNGDLFEAIKSGKASVVTDTITTWDETGIQLASGAHLDADLIVTATGLAVVPLGEVEFVVDEVPVDFSNTWTYKGFMYSDVPNMASSFGYINASWTLRADLIAGYVCRLLNWMERTGTVRCTPRLRPSDRSMPARPLIENFSAGYVQRVIHTLPRQGDREPWINPQNYRRDRKMFRKSPVDDGVMEFASLSREAAVLVAAARDS